MPAAGVCVDMPSSGAMWSGANMGVPSSWALPFFNGEREGHASKTPCCRVGCHGRCVFCAWLYGGCFRRSTHGLLFFILYLIDWLTVAPVVLVFSDGFRTRDDAEENKNHKDGATPFVKLQLDCLIYLSWPLAVYLIGGCSKKW